MATAPNAMNSVSVWVVFCSRSVVIVWTAVQALGIVQTENSLHGAAAFDATHATEILIDAPEVHF
jgi:hypothetical protein